MKPASEQAWGAVTSDLIKECVDLADQINLPTSDLALLCGTARATLYKWHKAVKDGELPDPEGKMSTAAFMNMLIYRVAAKEEINEERLPFDGKKGARKWVRQLAPEMFDSQAS